MYWWAAQPNVISTIAECLGSGGQLHAVTVDSIESILEVQAGNDKVGGMLLICHQTALDSRI